MSKIECPNCKNQSDEDAWVEAFQKHKCPACTSWFSRAKFKAIVRQDATPREAEKEGELHVRRIPAEAPRPPEKGWEARRKLLAPKSKSRGTNSVEVESESNPYSTWWNRVAVLLVIFGLGVALISVASGREDEAISGLALVLASLPLFLWAYVMNMAQRALRYLSIIAKRMDEREE